MVRVDIVVYSGSQWLTNLTCWKLIQHDLKNNTAGAKTSILLTMNALATTLHIHFLYRTPLSPSYQHSYSIYTLAKYTQYTKNCRHSWPRQLHFVLEREKVTKHPVYLFKQYYEVKNNPHCPQII